MCPNLEKKSYFNVLLYKLPDSRALNQWKSNQTEPLDRNLNLEKDKEF